MRTTLRLLAAVQRSTNFLEAGAPTGLTGLLTHASPRSTLLYLYSSTLEKLRQFPESSVYRQSTEALTRHRMGIIEGVRPAGLEDWHKRVSSLVEQYPEAIRRIKSVDGQSENVIFASPAAPSGVDELGHRVEPFEPGVTDYRRKANPEGPMDEDDPAAAQRARDLARDAVAEARAEIHIEPEPALSAEQVLEIEGAIGAGLLEEVIEVAEGERKLVDILAESKVWEDLEEKPVEGQWEYHERDRHTSPGPRR